MPSRRPLIPAGLANWESESWSPAAPTYFKGSSNTRVYNIEVAAEKLVGVVGSTRRRPFSFKLGDRGGLAGPTALKTRPSSGGTERAVGVGGGVCQVSTTVFRAALEGGFPFLERHNHGYVVSWYGDPGFDATIYTPYVDLRFLNDTDAQSIDPAGCGQRGRNSLPSTFTGRSRTGRWLSASRYTRTLNSPANRFYQEDASLEAGQIKQVEWAKEGLTATVIRKVTENGRTREDPIRSVYRPWNAMYLYGPGTVIPGVTDVAEPAPTPATEVSGGDS